MFNSWNTLDTKVSFKHAKNMVNGFAQWRILRTSDGIVIAQSKQPAAPQAVDPAAAPSDSSLPFAEGFGMLFGGEHGA